MLSAGKSPVNFAGLFVNRFMASIVGQYLFRFLRGEPSTSQIWVHPGTMEMIFVPVNQFYIDQYSTLNSARMQSG